MAVDPFIVIEIDVIVGAVIFLLRTLSPGQRARRRRQDARNRIEIRRALYGHPGPVGDGALAVSSQDRSHGAEAGR
ncbi:MAG TPA: hypothetical protein VHX38_35955 [Pseudonocardiaceae bacterium]|jgi:hypothetical protein|nr:hypothetical protein [Pseudonocardiaceae bacterium]